jgi:hypothetical protein
MGAVIQASSAFTGARGSVTVSRGEAGNKLKGRIVDARDYTFEQFAERMTTAKQRGVLYHGRLTAAEYAAASDNAKHADKSCGWYALAAFKGTRRGRNEVASVGALGFDVEAAGLTADELRKRLAGLEFVAVSSYGHLVEPDFYRWRVVVNLKAPITDMRHFDAVHAELRQRIGADSSAQAKDPSRLWYIPGCPPDMVDKHEAFYQRGEAFDPASVPAPAEQPKAKSERPKDAPPLKIDAERAIAKAKAWLAEHPVAEQGKGGDDHTFEACCRLKDIGVPYESMQDTLADWNGRCLPPWDLDGEQSLQTKIDSAFAEGRMKKPGEDSDEAIAQEFPLFTEEQWQEAKEAEAEVKKAEAEAEAAAEDSSFPEIPWAQGMREKARDPGEQSSEQQQDDDFLRHPANVKQPNLLKCDYLIKGWLDRGVNGLMFGPSNVGKSFHLFHMGACIALEQPWFGFRTRRGKVLYLGYEGRRGLDKRLAALRTQFPGLNDPSVPFRCGDLTHPLVQPQGRRELARALNAFAKLHGGPPDLLVIDPIQDALGGDDSDADLMTQLGLLTRVVMKRQGCAVLRVHHTGHSNQQRARGWSGLPAGVDSNLRVDAATDGQPARIVAAKQRDDEMLSRPYRLTVVELGTDEDGDQVKSCIIEATKEAPKEEDQAPKGPTTTQREALTRFLSLEAQEGRYYSTEDLECAAKTIGTGMTRGEVRHTVKVLSEGHAPALQKARRDGKSYHWEVTREPKPFE